MALVTFVADHLKAMRVKANAKSIAESDGISDRLVSIGAKTILATDGTVLGVMGAVTLLPNVCEVFILASEDQTAHAITFAKCVRKELYTLRAKYRRIQATAICDDFHKRWLSWLGFECEGILKSYGLNGEDMAIWGLV